MDEEFQVNKFQRYINENKVTSFTHYFNYELISYAFLSRDIKSGYIHSGITTWGHSKLATISHTTFWNAFS